MSAESMLATLSRSSGIRLVNSTELYPSLHQDGDAGLPLLLIENKLGRAVLALQGAHLIAFQPAGKDELLWLSPKAVLQAGKTIRGGIPLCTPWFGPGPAGSSAHGFARTTVWSLVAANARDDGSSSVALELSSDDQLHPAWPHAFRFHLEVIVGSQLELRFSAENRSSTAAPFAFAFHSYFAVPDVSEASVSGLDGMRYIDKLDRGECKLQHGEVTIAAATDRIYLDVPATQILRHAAGNVTIESDARCAVVWNAGTNDVNIADIGQGNHAGYLCVERADVAERAVTLQAGGQYRCWMRLA